MAPKRNHHSGEKLNLFIVGLSVCVVFGQTIFFDWLFWDDTTHILENPRMIPFSLNHLASYWRESFFNLYIPVTYSLWTAFAGLNLMLTGTLNAITFHFANVLWHGLNAILVYRLSLIVFRSASPSITNHHKPSLYSALIFALHPVQVESVAWISSFRELLSTSLLLLATLQLWSNMAQVPSPRSWWRASAWYVGALLSKPTAVIWPLAASLSWHQIKGGPLKRALTAPLLMSAFALPLILYTKSLQGDEVMNFVPSLTQRPLIALDALSFYLGKILLPVGLAPDYGRSPEWLLSSQQAYWTWAISSVFVFFGLFYFRRVLIVRVGLAWWLVTLLPVLGLIPFTYQGFSTVSDRYLYLPLIGFAWIGAYCLSVLSKKIWGQIAAAALFVVLGSLSFAQSRIWKSNIQFYEAVISLNPDSHMGHNGLSKTLIESNQLERALKHCQEALRIKPGNPVSLNNCGHILFEMKKYGETVDYFAKTFEKHRPTGNNHSVFSLMHTNMGAALIHLKKWEDAMNHLQEALKLNPNNAMAHHNIGAIHLMHARFEESLPYLKKSVELAPLNQLHRKNYDLAREKAASARARPTL